VFAAQLGIGHQQVVMLRTDRERVQGLAR